MIRNNRITLLEDIEINKDLPKHIKESSNDNQNQVFSVNGSIDISNMGRNNSNAKLYQLQMLYQNDPNIWAKFRIWLYKTFFMDKKDIPKKKIDPVELNSFFDSIKGSLSAVSKKNIEEVLENYNTFLENAKRNNQVALVERIEDYSEILKYELLLSDSKFKTYLSEENLVKFHNLASKHNKLNTNLCLTYIKNFAKVIPDNITKLKEEADELKIFDNYVILHYDYDGGAVKKTKKEIEKEKDPILFGVIKNSDKLYYIGDWVDDYCDLTLDQVIKKIGKKSVEKLTKKQIIKNINKI
jgi:hypothetical protein